LKKILVIQTASLGDVILSTPVLEKLHHVYPGAKIDFLMKAGYERIFYQHPYLHRVMVWKKSEKKYRHLLDLIDTIRKNKYDVVINLQRFASTGLITTFSGSPVRIGFSKNPFSVFFTRRVKHQIGKGNSNPHEITRNLSLLSHLTFSTNSNDSTLFPSPVTETGFSVKLYPSKHDYAKVSQFKTRQYITIAPGSLWFTKQFPEEKWVEFIRSLDAGLMVYFLGSPNEVDLCNRIINLSGHQNSLNLAGKLSFLESAALMKDAMMNYVNDSAPMHLASGINAPVTAIYCSTVPEFGFGPLSEKSFIVQATNSPHCRPCGLHGFAKCPEKHFDCAHRINNQQLLNTLK